MSFWYNVSTRQVETDDNRSAAGDLLGPFSTRAEAEGAIESAHRRAKSAEDADAAWNGEDD